MAIKAAASSGVIFTAYYRLGAGALTEVVSRKCFCTPGEKSEQMTNVDYQEITPGLLRDRTTLIGEALRGFVKGWNTEYHHHLATEREVALWGSFLSVPKDFWNARKMSIQRSPEDPLIYEAELVGDPNWLAVLSQGSFDLGDVEAGISKERQELEAYGFGYKTEVEIFAKNRYSSSALKCNMEQSFHRCLQEHEEAFDFYGIHPQALKQFALAPSVFKMTQVVNQRFPTIQHFSGVTKGPVREWSFKR